MSASGLECLALVGGVYLWVRGVCFWDGVSGSGSGVSASGPGECLPLGPGGVYLWGVSHPLGRHPPEQTPSLGRHPLCRHPHSKMATASYLNAFLSFIPQNQSVQIIIKCNNVVIMTSKFSRQNR